MKVLAAGDIIATRFAGGRRPAAGNTIIDDRWAAGNNKEGSRQEQTATNHCALKVGERWPAERAAGDEKGKVDADEEDEQRGGGL